MADRFYTPQPLGPGSFVLDGPDAHHNKIGGNSLSACQADNSLVIAILDCRYLGAASKLYAGSPMPRFDGTGDLLWDATT